jgi:DNA-binding MarR family transcriptional regulator
MNVHSLNNEKPSRQDSIKSLLLMDEIAKGEPLSQRDLSKRLNIALGLVNSYVRNLVTKGYVTIREIPSKRYVYYLTPKGFSEKTRLTYQHLQNFTSLYRNARRDFRRLFSDLQNSGVKRVVFAGADEVAEIAYLSLQDFTITLAGIGDNELAGKDFFRHRISSIDKIGDAAADLVIISSFVKKDGIYLKLIEHGVKTQRIRSIF